MRKVLAWLARNIDVRDLHAYGGISLVAAGLWKVYLPAAFIVSGAMLFYIAMRVTHRGDS